MEVVLRLEHLSKSFRTPAGAQQLILEIDAFQLEAGQQVALYGPSGSGKTTLLHVIAGVLPADRGQVVVAGTDMQRLREPQRDVWRGRHIGYVFQTFNLLQGYSALENVCLAMQFAGTFDRGRAEQLLAQVDLADRMHYRPKQLSVGQQQRVAIARALANRPSLVLADEPTGNLDPAYAQTVLDLMRGLCHEHHAALLLVSHDRAALSQFMHPIDLQDLNRAGRQQ